MASPVRQPDPDLTQSRLWNLLRSDIWSVHFFQAVRTLLRLSPGRASVGEFVNPSTEAVHFGSHPSMAFPASEIQDAHIPEDPSQPAHLTVNFMGLAAPTGALPTPYIEFIAERAQRKDHGFRDFLDVFNHRLISLFYRAWEKYRFGVRFERKQKDTLTPMLSSFVGLHTPQLAERQPIPDQALVYYSGIIAQHPRSAQSLERLIAEYFGVPAEVEQFVGKWVKVPRTDQTQLEDSEVFGQQLGLGVIVGDEVWDVQSSVRIKLGPLTLAQYLDFLPRDDARGHKVLQSLVRFYANDELDFELQLVLKDEETPGCEIGHSTDTGLLLGWTTWIRNAPLGRNPAEAVIQL